MMLPIKKALIYDIQAKTKFSNEAKSTRAFQHFNLFKGAMLKPVN